MSNKYTRDDVLSFMKEHFIMEIATISDNRPHASVMLYVVDDDFNIYFATHESTYKAKNLVKNPAISVCIWEHGKMLIQADGEAHLVEDTAEQADISDKLAAATQRRDDFWPPLFRTGEGAYVVFKMKPTWMRALELENGHITETEPPFTEIEL